MITLLSVLYFVQTYLFVVQMKQEVYCDRCQSFCLLVVSLLPISSDTIRLYFYCCDFPRVHTSNGFLCKSSWHVINVTSVIYDSQLYITSVKC